MGSRGSVDLFDDPAWPTEAPVENAGITSPRHYLVASLVLVALLLASMAFPWYTSAETPTWTPFSRWLNLGFGPGTQEWGILMLTLGIAMAAALLVGLVWPRRSWLFVLLGLATVLAAVTALEATAHLTVNPGPNLHADYGAWIGVAAAVVAWIGIAAASCAGWRRESAMAKNVGYPGPP